MAAPDPDPLYVEPDYIGRSAHGHTGEWCPVCVNKGYRMAMTPVMQVVPEPKLRSPAVILYLVLVAIATGAIIALLWWGLR